MAYKRQLVDILNGTKAHDKCHLFLLTPGVCPPAKLQAVIEQAEGPEAASEERKEVEELKALLPDIKERIEDASEGLKTGNTVAEAIQGALVS